MTSGRESERKHAATSCNRRDVATLKLNMHVIHFDLGLAVVDLTIFFSIESRLNDSTIDGSVRHPQYAATRDSMRLQTLDSGYALFGPMLSRV